MPFDTETYSASSVPCVRWKPLLESNKNTPRELFWLIIKFYTITRCGFLHSRWRETIWTKIHWKVFRTPGSTSYSEYVSNVNINFDITRQTDRFRSDRQTDRQTDRHFLFRQTDRSLSDRQTDRQTDLTDRQLSLTDRQTDSLFYYQTDRFQTDFWHVQIIDRQTMIRQTLQTLSVQTDILTFSKTDVTDGRTLTDGTEHGRTDSDGRFDTDGRIRLRTVLVFGGADVLESDKKRTTKLFW